MNKIHRKVAKISTGVAIAVLVSFMVISIAGLGMGMNMEQGIMMDCVFMAGAQDTWCPMQIQDHIKQWKSLLAGLPLSVAMLVAVFLVVSIRIAHHEGLEIFLKFRLHEHIKKKRLFSLFEYLRQIFSQGILNPKIYSLVIV